MNQSHFDDICEGVIRPIGEATAQKTFKVSQGRGVIAFAPDWQRSLYEAYEGWRFVAHDLMRDKTMLIDRHKIAASLALAILEFNPLQGHSINGNGKFLAILRIANEFLAFNVGMAIVIEFAIKAATKDDDVALADLLKGPVVFPSSTVENSSYRAQTYRALYHLRVLESRRTAGGNTLQGDVGVESFLVLSNLFFILEQYNLQAKRQLIAA